MGTMASFLAVNDNRAQNDVESIEQKLTTELVRQFEIIGLYIA